MVLNLHGMKYLFTLLLTTGIILQGCNYTRRDYTDILSRIETNLENGDFNELYNLADSLINNCREEDLVRKADSLSEIARRTEIEFSLTKEDIVSELKNNKVDFNAGDIENWEKKGWLEFRIINGNKKYFSRAVSNLGLLYSFYNDRASRDSSIAADSRIIFRRNHTSDIIRASKGKTDPVLPQEIEILYTLTVKPDVVPDGETVRCWLPFPKENDPRQTEVYLLAVSNEDFILSPDSMTHRTIYLEQKAKAGEPVIFSIAFSYKSYGQYFDPDLMRKRPYNRNSEIFKKYTVEEPPQICFTDNVKRLADSIAGTEEDPVRIVNKIFYWFNENIPWTSALEYSIIPDIPDYVIRNRRGDCGMQTFLLMSMLRYKGIPVKWQSGWMVPPGAENLHDWCEVWYEGVGWVPVDLYHNLQYSKNQKIKEFYISGIDSYRLIINDGIAGKLYPEKHFLRSEFYDFQRGEVEWDGGNLYFDKWDYSIKINYK